MNSRPANIGEKFMQPRGGAHKIGHSLSGQCGRRAVVSRAFQFAIRIDSIRYANRFESIRFVKNRLFDSLVVMQFLH